MPYLLLETNTDTIKTYLPSNYIEYFKSAILLQDTHTIVSHMPSPQSHHMSKDCLSNGDNESDKDDCVSNMHEFLLMHLTKSFDDVEIKRMYADYRSRGGIASELIKKRFVLDNVANDLISSVNSSKSKNKNVSMHDCLDVYQRWASFFCLLIF